MKKSFLIIFACLISLQVYGQEKYFHDLRGMEDSSGTTHLFYRIFDSNPTNSNLGEPTFTNASETNHIYHFNSKTSNTEFYLADYMESLPYDGFEYHTIGTFINPKNNPDSIVAIRGLFGDLYGDYYIGSEFGHKISLGYHNPLGLFYDRDLEAYLVTTPVTDIMIKGDSAMDKLGKTIIYDPKDPVWDNIHSYWDVPDSLLLDFTMVSYAGGGVYIGAKDSAYHLTINYGDSLLNYFGEEFYLDETTIIGHDYHNGLYEFRNRYSDSLRLMVVNEWNGGKFHYLVDYAEIYNFTTYSPYTSVKHFPLVSRHYLYYSREDSLFNNIATYDYLMTAPGEDVHLTNFSDRITGLYLKPQTDSLFVLTTKEFFRYDISEDTKTKLLSLPVSSESESSEIPNQINLEQNYPNPFNPATVISYQLNSNQWVRLEVFDMTGRKVAVLVDGERKPAGNHRVYFDAAHLSSGMYIYRIEAGDYVQTRKMVLVK